MGWGLPWPCIPHHCLIQPSFILSTSWGLTLRAKALSTKVHAKVPFLSARELTDGPDAAKQSNWTMSRSEKRRPIGTLSRVVISGTPVVGFYSWPSFFEKGSIESGSQAQGSREGSAISWVEFAQILSSSGRWLLRFTVLDLFPDLLLLLCAYAQTNAHIWCVHTHRRGHHRLMLSWTTQSGKNETQADFDPLTSVYPSASTGLSIKHVTYAYTLVHSFLYSPLTC